MPSINVVGSHTYNNFLSSSSYDSIQIDENKFTELKKKRLSNQFSVEDMLSVIKAPEIYDINDIKKWELKYAYSDNTNEFRNDLIKGETNFTFKYLKPSDFPSNINETNYTINVSSQTTSKNSTEKVYDGKGTQKIIDYIWDDRVPSLISFDQEHANILTGSKTLDEILANIDLILLQTISINNRWFDTNQFVATLDKENSTNKQAKFSLNFKDNKIVSNINIFTNDGSLKKLVFDKSLRDEIKKIKENIFDIPKITFNHSLLDFDWKYGLTSNDGNFMELSFNTLISKVNEDRINQGLELLNFNVSVLPTDFLKNFDGKNFNDYFPLIETKNSSTSSSDPWYYQVSKTEIIPNDENGNINIRYELIYPNLSSSTQVYKNPEVKITGFKSKTFTNSLSIVLISIFCFIAIFLIIFIPIIINIIHHKKINSNKIRNNKAALQAKYKNKVIKR